MERHLRSQSVMLQVWARLLDVLRRSKRLNRLGDYPRCVLALSVSRSESAEEGIEITQIGEKISLKVQEFLETGKIQEASTFWNSFLHSFKDMRLSVRDPTRYSWFEDEWEIPRFERITICTRNRFARRFSLPMSHCAALIGSFRLGTRFQLCSFFVRTRYSNDSRFKRSKLVRFTTWALRRFTRKVRFSPL